MSEENQTNEPKVTPATELEMLQERARLLGINPGNSGVDSLKAKINAKLEDKPEPLEETQAPTAAPVAAEAVRAPRPKTKAEIEQDIREEMYREQMKLKRVQIHNLNPDKSDLPGEFIVVRNRYLGTVRKYIPFGEHSEAGYHIPVCLYNELKSRRFQAVRVKKINGREHIESRIVPEYNIIDMPPLTAAELEELALKQAAAERVGAE